MTQTLIERLTQELNYPEVTLDNHDAFIETPGLNVLFFPGNPETVKDATDVAVVLPELIAAFAPQLKRKLTGESLFFTHFPSLVFVRDGDYVGTISRIQDWADYLTKINVLLSSPGRRAPGFSIPVIPG